MQSLPKLVVGLEAPRDRLGVGESGAFALGVALRGLEVHQVVQLAFRQVRNLGGLTSLVPAVLALDRPRYVDATQLLQGVIDHAATEQLLPRLIERPECDLRVGPDRGTFGTRGTLGRAALHDPHHLGVHPLEWEVGDSLPGSVHFASVVDSSVSRDDTDDFTTAPPTCSTHEKE